jgi:hypothetical protein
MHLTAPSHWSRSIVAGGRDAPEQLVTIVVVRNLQPGSGGGEAPAVHDASEGRNTIEWVHAQIVLQSGQYFYIIQANRHAGTGLPLGKPPELRKENDDGR